MSHRVRSLSHTADVGFRVEAATLAGLFASAAWGLIGALTDVDPGSLAVGPGPGGGGEGDGGGEGEAGSERLRLSRPDRERLLVAWLRELLHRALSEGRIPAAVDVKIDAEGELTADIRWRAPGGGPELVREIKGVTYHGLAIRRTEEGWSASVVLDI